MADDLFEHPRLAAVYDALDPDRSDLDVYAAIVTELDARHVMDVGCGTGTFALMLTSRGVDVVAVDPAGASLDVARGKPGADKVRWVHGDATAVPEHLHGRVDLAVMTGNVAQAIVDEQGWLSTLNAVGRCLRPGGHLVFETRRPERRGWEEWTREQSETVTEVPRHGSIRHWVQLTEVNLPLVTFEAVRVFESRPSPRPLRCGFAARTRSRPRLPPAGTTSGRYTRPPTARAVSSCSWRGVPRDIEMEQAEVLSVLDTLQAADMRVWVAGGWGVDALVGRQTRDHRDLDLLVDAERLDECLSLLAARGYAVETDWLPVRVEVVAAGRGWVHVHPVRLAADGSGVQAGLDGTRFDYPADCFTTGSLSSREVPCLTASHQRLLHTGYVSRGQDVHDLQRLNTLEPEKPA